MSNNNRLVVSERAVIQRINRKLRPDLQMLRKARGVRAVYDVGQFCVVDLRRNLVLHTHVDVEDLAHELEVLKPWEEVA